MITKMKSQDNEAKIRALQSLNSGVTKQVLMDMVYRYVVETGHKGDVEINPLISDYHPGKLMVAIYITDSDCYDWLMDQKTTCITENITSRETKTMFFASHGNTYVEIDFIIKCKLPEEDFKTLDMLGKVHRELVPSRVDESIYCEI